jgi:N-acetylglucosamine-6-phosphate deacetylase
MTDWLIAGMTVYAEQGMLSPGAVRIQHQHIGEIFNHPAPSFTGKRLDFPANYCLIPGRIDLHIHGAQGADVMDATPAALTQICQALAAEGVTGFLATTMTDSPENITRALRNLAQCHRTEILGVHLEGPFIAPQQIGAHRSEYLLPPDPHWLARWQKDSGGKIRWVTLAPELPGAIDFIRYLCEQGMIAAIGHTQADFAVTESAIAAGASHITHLFNAMRAFHHREPGCVGAALLDARVSAEVIADGHHCHPAALNLALRLKGRDGLVLVTDAMRAKCCEQRDSFDLGGQAVTVQAGAARLKNGTLAGSVLTMTQAAKNMQHFTGCSLSDLIAFTSLNPARLLHREDKKGSIAVGKDADLVVLNECGDVVMTIHQGNIIYRNHIDARPHR